MKALTDSHEWIEMERGQVIFADDEQGRLYVPVKYLPNPTEDKQFPSTTTVKGMIQSSLGKTRIQRWRDRLNDPEEVLRWYQARGEIAHEFTYEKIAKERPEIEHTADIEIPRKKLDEDYTLDYFPISDDPYDTYAITSGQWASDKLSEALLEDIKQVIMIEQYVVNEEVGYAGQFDLLYLSEDNNLVLTDLKTSQDLHDDYRFQISAYYCAMPWTDIIQEVEAEHDVEVNEIECQIIRANPETKTIQVETCSDWRADPEDYFGKFEEMCRQFRFKKLPIKSVVSGLQSA